MGGVVVLTRPCHTVGVMADGHQTRRKADTVGISERTRRAVRVAVAAGRSAALWVRDKWEARRADSPAPVLTLVEPVAEPVAPVELNQARPDPAWLREADDLRADILKMAARTLDEAMATLELHGCARVQSPPDGRKTERTVMGDRRRVSGSGGTWDWWSALSKKEQARLRRNGWVTREPGAVTPDEIPELLGMTDWADIDAGMAEWVRLTRVVDGCKSLAHRRRVPAWCAQHEIAPSFDDWDADLILSPDRAAAALHVEQVDAELAARDRDERDEMAA